MTWPGGLTSRPCGPPSSQRVQRPGFLPAALPAALRAAGLRRRACAQRQPSWRRHLRAAALRRGAVLRPACALDRGLDHDLDIEAGGRELRLRPWRAPASGPEPPRHPRPFISAQVLMSVSQILALRILVLSVPASFSVASICARMSWVCSLTDLPTRRLGDEAGEIDLAAMDDGIAHAVAGLDAFQWHVFLL